MKTATTLLSYQWIQLTILLCFLHLQALAFIAVPSFRVCPDMDNTSLMELNDRNDFCIGDTAIYVATFDGATDPTVTFYWDENLDGVPDPGELITTGIEVGVDFRATIIITEDRIGGQILVLFEDGDCPDEFIRTLSEEPLILACGVSIEDPCFCLNNTVAPGTGQFSETIVVTGIPGQVWEIVEVEGLFAVGASVPPLVGEQLMAGDLLEEDLLDNTRYFIEGVHIDGIGYSITVTNGPDTLMISNQCSYPDPQINVLPNYCVNFPAFEFEVTDETFTGTFEVSVNGNPETEFVAANLGPGLHVVTYTFFAEPQEPGYPSCEQTRNVVVQIFNDYQGTISCFTPINVGFNNDGQVIVTPDLVLSSNYGCTATFEVEIVGKDDNILTCADANIPQTVIVRDPIRGGVCWSTVVPEDKSPPVFVCEDVTVSCTIDLFNLPADAFVEVSDNCGVESLIVISQQPIDNPDCDPNFSAAFTRTLRATDAMGNSATCVQTIFLDRPELADVEGPGPVEIIGCAETTDISPAVTGFPTIDGEPLGFFCELSAFYNDMDFIVCQGSRFVMRTWFVFDHCAGTNVSFDQEIWVRDIEAPEIECPADAELGTDPNQCSATYIILPPTMLIDNCVPNEDLTLVVFVNGVQHMVGDEVVLPLGSNTLLYRVNDPCLNYSNCTQIIEVIDTQSPTLVCNPFTASLDENGEVTIVPSDLINNSYFDNCALADTLLAKMTDPDNFQAELTYDCSEIGINMLIIQVTDEAGNANTCMVDLTIQDLIPPIVVFCPADVVVECNIDPFPDFEEPIFEDNCEEQLIITFSQDTVPDCCGASVITRTWVATDVQGMSATCEQIIEVIDTTPPDIVCEAVVTVSLDGSGMGSLTMGDVIISATDLCCEEDLDFSLSLSAFTCDDIDEDITVTATVADQCGNETTCDFDVIVLDELGPVFDNCQDTINFLISDFNECAIGFYNAMVQTPTATDNCTDNIVVSRSFVNEQSICGGPDAGIGSRIYTFMATDDVGNVSTCTTVVRLIDDVAPMITCVDTEVEIFLDSNGEASISSTALFIDIDDFCDNNAELIVEDFNFTCEDLGMNAVSIRGIDCAGNIGTCTSTVVVIDLVDPEITCPADVTVECLDNDGMPTDPEFTGFATATDNCDVVLVDISNEVFSGTDCDQLLERTFRAVDQSGNEDFCTQNITIEDNTPPVSICTEAIQFITVAECDGNDPDIALSEIVELNGDLIADCYVDECGNGVEVTNDYMAGSIMMDCEDFGGTITITYTVADDCGNIAATIEVILSLVDRTGPVFTLVPDDATFECGDAIPDPDLDSDVTAVDECSAVTGITFEDFPMMTPWIVTSQSGNGLVDISDAPNSITIQSSNTGFNQNLFAIASSAAKAGTLSFDWSYETTDPNGPSNDPFGIIIEGVTQIITDNAGAQIQNGSESFPILAGNSIELFIETLNNQSGEATVLITNIQFVEADMECPVVDCFIRRFIAEDACGNQGVAYQLITIVDTEAPILMCQDVTLQLDGNGEAVLDPQLGVTSATDACSTEITLEANITSFSCLDLSTPQTVTITATDECDNEATCDILVTVEDLIEPVLMCVDTVTFLMSDFGGDCGAYIGMIPEPPASDNCEVVSVTRSGSPIEGICGGTLVGSRLRLIEFVATDQSGNQGTCELVLRVIDDVAPTLTCVEDFTVSLDADGNGAVEADDLLIDIEDNCPNTNAALVAETFSFTCEDLGANMITLSGVDCAGNIGTCLVNIIVEDNLGPNLECVAEATLVLNADGTVTIDDPLDFVVNLTDNCSEDFIVMIETDEFDCSDIAASPISVQLVAIDEAGNPTFCTIDITIEDQTEPVFQNCTDRIFNLSEFADCNYIELLDADFFGLTAEDVCDGLLSIGTGALSNQVDFCNDIDNPGSATGTATFTVADIAGNVATCEIDWTIVNDVPPTLDCVTIFEVTLDDVTGIVAISATDLATATYPLDDCFTDPASWLTLVGQSSFDCSDVGADIEVMVVAATCGSPESSCTVVIEVIDPNPVSVLCPAPTTIECGSNIDAFADAFEDEFSAEGLCLESTNFDYTVSLNDCGLGTVTFTYSAESTYGDMASCQVVVDVVQAPGSVFVESMIEWPEDFVSKCAVNLPEPITPQFTGGPEYPIGLPCLDIRDDFVDVIIEANLNGCQIRERNWTLTDICTGTSFSYTQLITLSLEGTQIVSGPTSMQVLHDPGQCGAQIDLDPLVVTDCAGDLLIENDFNANGADASGFYPVGITVVNFTIINGCEDQEPNIYTITIEVVDNQSPSLTCGNNVTTTCSADLDAVVAGIGFTVMDNCPDLTLDTTLVFNLDDCGVGFVVVTFSAADQYNQASCSRIITVNADADFVLSLADFDLPADMTLACGEDITILNTGFPEANSPLLCAAVEISLEDEVLSDDPELGCQTILRTFTLEDVCSGSELEYTQTIVISGDTPNIISGPASLTVPNDMGACGADLVIGQLVLPGCAEDLIVVNDFNDTADASDFYPVGTTEVTFTVTNACGNESVFIFEVTVEDVEDPVVDCPADVSVSCLDDLDDFIAGLDFDASDNCGLVSTEVTYDAPAIDCGSGSTLVTYTAVDIHGNDNSCSLEVTITPVFLQASDITWPEDYSLACGEDRDDTDITGSPEFEDFCGTPVATFEDADEETDVGGCITFIRTWTISDACNPVVTFDYEQTISVPNYGNLAELNDEVIMVLEFQDDNECGAEIVLNFPTGDFCAGDVTIENSFNNGGADASGFYEVGTTMVTYTISNSCGEIFSTIAIVTIVDLTAPDLTCGVQTGTVTCADDLLQVVANWDIEITEPCPVDTTITFMTNLNDCGVGTVTFVFSVTDNSNNTNACTRTINVSAGTQTFTQLTDVTWPESPLIVEDCDAEIDPLVLGSEPIINGEFLCLNPVITFEDEEIIPSDDPDFCRQFVRTWTITSSCDGEVLATFGQTIYLEADGMPLIVDGHVKTYEEIGVANVEVTGRDGSRGSEMSRSLSDGKYRLRTNIGADGLIVTPYKNDDALLGVSSIDLLMISRHLHGIEPLSNPYNIIAADANRDGRITIRDIILLRDLLLGRISNLPEGNWRFVDKAYEFINPLRPLSEAFAEEVTIPYTDAGRVDVDFVAVKMGDAFQSNNAFNGRQAVQDHLISAEEVRFKAGEMLDVPLRLEGFEKVATFQFALRFDPAVLQFVNLNLPPSISEQNINIEHADLGLILISWDYLSTEALRDQEIMSIQFMTGKDGVLSSSISITEYFVKPELYLMESTAMKMPKLVFEQKAGETGAFELFQNQPNPFSNFTKFMFSIPEADDVNLTVYDVSGKVVHFEEAYFASGMHAFILNNQLAQLADGTYFYRIKTGTYSATKKMILSSGSSK